VRVRDEDRDRIVGMAKLEGFESMPLLPTAVLPPDWRDSNLWLRFTR